MMSSLYFTLDWLNPLWWVGPVLDKELRVLSRRKRTYWMKGLFPVFLVLVMVSAWIGAGRGGGGLSAAELAGMAQVSRTVVSSMTWMQFILCQCMAVLMMSHAMHDEIRRRTLDVLMTTPIRSVQIVLGKLLGQLMMVWVVLALSFPVLAIVRVWGGVSWDYLVATGCVTVCATLCVASFSLCLALWVKRAHQGILVVLSFLVLGYMVNILGPQLSLLPTRWLTLLSPFSVFYALNAGFNAASNPTQGLWLPHCALMLGLSAVFVVLCVATLRRRMLNTIHGDKKERVYRLVTRAILGRKRRQDLAIRSVTGPPVLWKELGGSPRAYLVTQRRWITLLCAGLIVCMWFSNILFQVCVTLLRYMVLLRVGMMAALCVAQEKEARTWTAMLGTPVPDIWLLRHKAMAVLMKNASGWIPLFVASAIYLAIPRDNAQQRLFNFMGMFSLIATLYMVTGMGLYCSVRMKTGAMAITAMVILWFVWQLVMQFVMVLVMMNMRAFRGSPGFSSMLTYFWVMPILSVVAGAVMFKLAGRNLRKYAF
ncbi:MAG: ABC transporter permease [Phycisphaerae bacterium]|nr:ABC transporter permease [Phycisphaerae bacterium]